MHRPVTDLNLALLFPLLGHSQKSKTEEKYLEKIQAFERKCEKSLQETLSRLNVDARVKSDPYSLPWQDELIVTLHGESYLNGPYEFHRVAKKIVKELLARDVEKIRFYFFINVLPCALMGKVEYRFRYFVHY